MTEFERRVTVKPAFERIHDDPARNFGICCALIRFALIGPGAAVSWEVFSGWYLPHVAQRLRKETAHERYGHGDRSWMRCSLEGHGGAMCTHSPTQIFEHDPKGDKCDLLPGGRCFGDIGFLIGDDLFDVLVAGGDEALWKRMATIYESVVEQAADWAASR